MKSRRTAITAALAALAISGGSLAYSATASAQDRAGTAPTPGTAEMAAMHERMTDSGMARMHERMTDPGMVRMQELMVAQNPGMARMHELMVAQNPGMARMHERMTDGSR